MSDQSPKLLDTLKQRLTAEEFRITQLKGTERAFSGKYWQCDGSTGTYNCKCCGQALFNSESKFDSGSGWPSFFTPIFKSSIAELPDNSLDSSRIEVLCANCHAHLGHVFNDGPQPTGMRYCVNSASIDFQNNN